jgi:hypothetical protein
MKFQENPLNTTLFSWRPNILGPTPKIKFFHPILSASVPEVSTKVRHIPVEQ